MQVLSVTANYKILYTNPENIVDLVAYVKSVK